MSKRLFLKQLLTSPRTIGAAFPSSPRLADHMAACVPAQFEGSIVELGPGTGVVTQALLKRGIPPHRIVAVEYSLELVKHLQKKFPEVSCIHGDAVHLKSLLNSRNGHSLHQVDVVVSSLPLKSLPNAVVKCIVHELDQIVSATGRIIQFTYDLRKDVQSPFPSFQRSHSKIIWQNIPPARVSVFERIPTLVGKL